MVNLTNSDVCEFISQGVVSDNISINYLNMFSHRLHGSPKVDLNEQLLSSLNENVTSDKVKLIEELLKKGADPNAINSSGNRPIHLAIMNSPGNIELVLEIIRYGADLNVVNTYGSTPLTFSLETKCHKTTEILIKRGADINFQCQRGWTPLMIATMVGDIWSVRTLLEHGANVNTYDNKRKTALMFAILGNYYKIIKELLEYGANPSMRDATNKTALRIYLKKSYPSLDVVNVLLLHCASFVGSRDDVVESFLKLMDKCLNLRPYNHACKLTIVKILMLLTNNHELVTKHEDYYDLAVDCCTEIRYMEQWGVNTGNHIAQLLRLSLEGRMPKESELEGLLPFLANDYFPLYANILKACLIKPFVKIKFMNSIMYAKKEGKSDEFVFLNSDINLKIRSYLSDDDLTRFVLAAYVKNRKVSAVKTTERSLNPLGKSYSWKDVMED